VTAEEFYGLNANPTQDSTPSDSLELDALAASWARLGVLFGVQPSREPVDLELLICITARVAPEDERARCRPLATPRPLVVVMRSMRVLTHRVRCDALPAFASWGLWHDDQTLKPAAVRPLAWALQNVPELRNASASGDRPHRFPCTE
jgi:hypothetical protein